MTNPPTNLPQPEAGPKPGHITLMAAASLRDALNAAQRGETAAATAGLMSIDADSWQAIQQRIASLGGSVPGILADLSDQQ